MTNHLHLNQFAPGTIIYGYHKKDKASYIFTIKEVVKDKYIYSIIENGKLKYLNFSYYITYFHEELQYDYKKLKIISHKLSQVLYG